MNIVNPYRFGIPFEITDFILEVKTDNTGTSGTNQYTITTLGAGYNYTIITDDGHFLTGNTGNVTITFSAIGTYQVGIRGTFPKIYHNNGGDRRKVLQVLQWGSVGFSTDQTGAFDGCSNMTAIASDVTPLNSIVNGSRMFGRCTILASLPSGLVLGSVTNGTEMFITITSLTSLPTGMTLASLTTGTNMFNGCTVLTGAMPSGMTLGNLVTGTNMFNGCAFTSLPTGMVMGTNLLTANFMFANITELTSLPTGMTCASVTNGASMFISCTGLSTLPSGMVFDNLTNGSAMFANDNLTSLPTGMVLGSVTNGLNMFLNNNFTTLPSGMTLGNLTDGTSIFQGITLNTADYDTLLNNIVANTPASTVTFHGGSSKYTAGNVDSGTTDGATTAFKLIDSTQNFNTTVTVGDVVRRSSTQYAFVDAIDSDTQLTLSHDIMVTGVAYTIEGNQAAKDRATLDLTNSWTITDGGPV